MKDSKVLLAVIIAVTVLTLSVLGLVMGLYAFGESDPEHIIIIVGAFLAIVSPTTVALLALLKSNEVHTEMKKNNGQ